MSEKPAKETTRSLDQQVDWQLLRRVFENEAIASLYTMIVASVLASLVTVVSPGSIIPWAWWAVIVVLVVFRMYAAKLFQSTAVIEQATEWIHRYTVSTTLTGAAWGVGSASMMLTTADLKIHVVILVVVGAMAAAAVVYQGAILAAYLGYVLGALGPLAAVLALNPNAEMLDIATLALVYCVALWTVGRRYNHDLRATVRLGLDKQRMSEELSRTNLQLEADVDARLRAERLLSVERNVLENVAREISLSEVLNELCLDLEAFYPGSHCSVVFLKPETQCIEHGPAPSLPLPFLEALNGLPIGPEAGSCGSAMYSRQTVVTRDIAEDPLWRDYRETALAHGLRACWSTPILSRTGDVFGSFAIYHREPYEPTNEETETINRMSQLIALVMEDIGNSQKILISEQRFRDFAGAAADWFWELDANLDYTFVSESARESDDWPKHEILQRTREELRRFLNENAGGGAVDPSEPVVIEFTVAVPGQPDIEVLSIARPVTDEHGGVTGWRGVGRDVTRERQLEREIKYQADHDSLTGLVNRREFERLVGEVLAGRSDRGDHYVAFIDLDRFKWINDNAGHRAGDEVLKRVADLLCDNLPDDQVAARLGGDEFAASFAAPDPESAMAVMQRVVDALTSARFSWSGNDYRIGASVGLVRVTSTHRNFAQVMSEADSSCYRAKHQGGSRVSLFRPDLDLYTDDARSTGELIRALRDSRTIVHVQEIRGLRNSDHVPWYEVLLRYNAGGDSATSPCHLIPAAERYGGMGIVDIWVLEQALERWGDLLSNDVLRISLNLSATSIAHQETVGEITKLVEQAHVSPGALCFEVTETSTLSNLGGAAQFMRDLRELGCGFVIDNFGGGQSNFSYLKALPGDYLAIDGGYVRTMASDRTNYTIVDAIHKVGRAHGMMTLAKSVETENVLHALRGIGVDYAQGYFIARAKPASELDARKLSEAGKQSDVLETGGLEAQGSPARRH